MDFTFTEEQETIAKVARQLLEHRATPQHLTELEAGEARFDTALWRELANADLLGIALSEDVGGSGQGFLELALLLSEVGWSVAPVPVYATLLLGQTRPDPRPPPAATTILGASTEPRNSYPRRRSPTRS
jgi:alkylation response protein AidB-like acyl-CoA dehydrogenase